MSTEKQNSIVTQFIDANISSLKLKIKEVELDINSLEIEKAEIERLIHEFEIRHNHELGDIILAILKIRKEKLEDEVKKNKDKQDEYEEAEKEYEDFQNNFEKTRNEKNFDLTSEEKGILKIKYRQASKLCHPDIVNDNLKEEAEQIFKELNEAYEKNDLNKITKILENLEKGTFISKSDSVNQYENLQIVFDKIILKREHLFRIIDNMKSTDTYQIIDKLTDWDKYFSETRQQLRKELYKLQNNE